MNGIETARAWMQRDRYYIESDDGYRISKAFGPGLAYAAWAPRATGEPLRAALLYSDSRDACMQACAEHSALISN